MKKLLLILFISLGLISSAGAVSSLDDYYTSTCTSEQTIGFTWKDNAWQKVNFKAGTKYEVTKLDPAKMAIPWCPESKANYQYYSDELNQHGCYSIKTPGTKDNGIGFDCRETWSLFPKQDGELNAKTKKLELVTCARDEFHFAPNGSFQTGQVSRIVKPISDTKGDMYVSFGKCSTGSSSGDINLSNTNGQWTTLDKRINGETFYIDLDSIKTIDGFIYYWYLRDYPEPYMGILSEKVYVQGDCGVSRIKDLSFHFYKKTKGRDFDVKDNPESPEWRYVAPETFGGFLLNLNCSLEEKMKPMSAIERIEFIEEIKKL